MRSSIVVITAASSLQSKVLIKCIELHHKFEGILLGCTNYLWHPNENGHATNAYYTALLLGICLLIQVKSACENYTRNVLSLLFLPFPILPRPTLGVVLGGWEGSAVIYTASWDRPYHTRRCGGLVLSESWRAVRQVRVYVTAVELVE